MRNFLRWCGKWGGILLGTAIIAAVAAGSLVWSLGGSSKEALEMGLGVGMLVVPVGVIAGVVSWAYVLILRSLAEVVGEGLARGAKRGR